MRQFTISLISSAGGLDYQGSAFRATFLPGEGNSVCFNITILPDTIVEPSEHFLLVLSLPSGVSQSVQLGNTLNATVTIVGKLVYQFTSVGLLIQL